MYKYVPTYIHIQNKQTQVSSGRAFLPASEVT